MFAPTYIKMRMHWEDKKSLQAILHTPVNNDLRKIQQAENTKYKAAMICKKQQQSKNKEKNNGRHLFLHTPVNNDLRKIQQSENTKYKTAMICTKNNKPRKVFSKYKTRQGNDMHKTKKNENIKHKITKNPHKIQQSKILRR